MQAALFVALSQDAPLSLMLSREWDLLPAIFPYGPDQDAESSALYPYITFLPQGSTPWGDKDKRGENVVYQVNIWTRTEDYDQGNQIAAQVTAILDRQDLTIVGACHVTTELESLTPSLDPDGVTRRHLMLFRVIYQDT